MRFRIEEMAKDLRATYNPEGCEAWHCGGCSHEQYSKEYFCQEIQQAEKLAQMGYHKQSEGEWKIKRTAQVLHISCSVCNYTKRFDRLASIADENNYIIDDFTKEHRFCPNCGTKN